MWAQAINKRYERPRSRNLRIAPFICMYEYAYVEQHLVYWDQTVPAACTFRLCVNSIVLDPCAPLEVSGVFNRHDIWSGRRAQQLLRP